MKPIRRRFYIQIFSLLVFLSLVASTWMIATAGEGGWRVYFSPGGGATEAIVKALGRAQTSVYVQAFSFTSSPIAKALTQAQRRGVRVEAILDKSNLTDRYSAADFLVHAEIPTYIDSTHAIAHNKIMIIDGHLVITGSFNFTKAAESSNAENLLIIDDQELAARYLENWQLHARHSEKYHGKDQFQGRGRGVAPKPLTWKNLLKNVIEGAKN